MNTANLKTSQSMPVENYSVVAQSENGTQFNPGMKTVFRVPSHLSFVDFNTSYMFFDFEVKNEVAKMEFTNGGVPEMLLRTWRVLIGGHIVEEIDHPNVLVKALKYDYGMDLGMREISQVINKSGENTSYQGFNGMGDNDDGKTSVADPPVDGTTSICDKIKIVLDLKFSGIFGSTQTFPVGMTGDVMIECIWEEARKVLKVIDGGQLPMDICDQAQMRLNAGCAVVSLPPGGVATTITAKASEHTSVPNHCGIATIAECPFSIGQAVRITGKHSNTNAQYDEVSPGNITDITIAGGVWTLTLGTGFGAPSHAINHCRVSFPTLRSNTTDQTKYDNGGKLTYEISVPTLALQVVVPPPQYVEAQAMKVAREGLAIDVPTYTCYKSNTYAGIKSATIDIPCFSSRARSLLCIGVPQQNLGGNNVLSGYKVNGLYDDLHQYQFQIGEEREPVRPVNCENLSTYQQNVAQEQLTELDKALKAGGCEVRSLRNYHENFIIGRALSAYGGSIPLTMKGARLYIDYLQQQKRTGDDVPVVAKNWFVYCHHIRRLMITGQGIQVMY